MRALLITLALLLGFGLASAQTIYRCTAPDGRVSIQQALCDTHKGAKAQAMAVPQANVAEAHAGEALRAMEMRVAIARGQIVEGMTEAEVRQVMGQPYVVNTDRIEGRVNRQLVYRFADGSTRYVYTRDGVTYATQDRPGLPRPPEPRRPCFTDEQIQGADANAGSLLHSGAEQARRRAEVQRMKLNRC